MNKDFIELSEHQLRMLVDDCYDEEEGYVENDDIGFSFIKESTDYTDIDKGYREIRVIVQDNITKRFYSFCYTDSHYQNFKDSNEHFPIRAYEVFPKQVTTTVYE